jgi:preprotein translocase subunit SecG
LVAAAAVKVVQRTIATVSVIFALMSMTLDFLMRLRDSKGAQFQWY